MSSKHWSIRRRPLALLGPGRHPIAVPVTKIGEGSFSACLRGKTGWMRNSVFLVTFIKSKEKELLVSVASKSVHLPQIHHLGLLAGRRAKWNLYKMPWYSSRLSAKNRAIEQALTRCVAVVESDPDLVNSRGQAYSRMVPKAHQAFVRCAQRAGVPPAIISALRVLNQAAKRSGEDFFYDFAGRNVAQDREGNLILLDPFITLDASSVRDFDWLEER